jgi:hypothetical protein
MTDADHAMRAAPQPAAETTKGTDQKWWTLVAVSLGTFMLLLDRTYKVLTDL